MFAYNLGVGKLEVDKNFMTIVDWHHHIMEHSQNGINHFLAMMT